MVHQYTSYMFNYLCSTLTCIYSKIRRIISYFFFVGTVSIISSDPPWKRYPWNLYLAKNLEDAVVFWHEKFLFLWVSPMLLINKKCTKALINNSYLIRQSFMGTVVNRALPSLHKGSLEITLTVPWNSLYLNYIKSSILLF